MTDADLTWPALRVLMERPSGRTRAWRELGAWTLDSLEAQLGPETLARRLAAGQSPQPICSASSTMIPSGPRT